jgi:hypothetical protein
MSDSFSFKMSSMESTYNSLIARLQDSCSVPAPNKWFSYLLHPKMASSGTDWAVGWTADTSEKWQSYLLARNTAAEWVDGPTDRYSSWFKELFPAPGFDYLVTPGPDRGHDFLLAQSKLPFDDISGRNLKAFAVELKSLQEQERVLAANIQELSWAAFESLNTYALVQGGLSVFDATSTFEVDATRRMATATYVGSDAYPVAGTYETIAAPVEVVNPVEYKIEITCFETIASSCAAMSLACLRVLERSMADYTQLKKRIEKVSRGFDAIKREMRRRQAGEFDRNAVTKKIFYLLHGAHPPETQGVVDYELSSGRVRA